MSAVLVIAENDHSLLAPVTGNVIGAAAQIGADCIDVAVLADDARTVAFAAAALSGVDRVLRIERPSNSPYTAAIWAPQIAALATGYTHVLAPATTFGKDLLPRVAAILGVGMLSDITGIESPYCFRRPIYAGNAIVSVAADAAQLLCATVRPTAFAAPAGVGAAVVEALDIEVDVPSHTRFREQQRGDVAGPDLQTAPIVVAGGRGLGGSAAMTLVAELAAALGAAVGASRAAVDAGWAANDLQIGQTGKIIAPELYLALGISGAIQHLTGIRDARTIVAINTDADAPICAVADIVLIQDLYTAVPELIARLKARRETQS